MVTRAILSVAVVLGTCLQGANCECAILFAESLRDKKYAARREGAAQSAVDR